MNPEIPAYGRAVAVMRRAVTDLAWALVLKDDFPRLARRRLAAAQATLAALRSC